MSTFALVTIVVCFAGVVVAALPSFRVGHVLQGLGRTGLLWIDHQQDIPVADLPSEDEPDNPLPRRPLRGRPE